MAIALNEGRYANDVLIPADHNLLWKKVGQSGWLTNCPVVVQYQKANDDGFRGYGDPTLEVVTIISVVPDNLSELWVWSQMDFDKKTVKDHLVLLPLRFRGQVYEEGISRAKNYLIDRRWPDVGVTERTAASWYQDDESGQWTLDLGSEIRFRFGNASETDPLRALAAAVGAEQKYPRGF